MTPDPEIVLFALKGILPCTVLGGVILLFLFRSAQQSSPDPTPGKTSDRLGGAAALVGATLLTSSGIVWSYWAYPPVDPHAWLILIACALALCVFLAEWLPKAKRLALLTVLLWLASSLGLFEILGGVQEYFEWSTRQVWLRAMAWGLLAAGLASLQYWLVQPKRDSTGSSLGNDPASGLYLLPGMTLLSVCLSPNLGYTAGALLIGAACSVYGAASVMPFFPRLLGRPKGQPNNVPLQGLTAWVTALLVCIACVGHYCNDNELSWQSSVACLASPLAARLITLGRPSPSFGRTCLALLVAALIAGFGLWWTLQSATSSDSYY